MAACEQERDPLGALATYLHYIFDVHDVVVVKQAEIDWSLNKTWRQVRSPLKFGYSFLNPMCQVRVLFGKEPKAPHGSQNLYHLFVKALHMPILVLKSSNTFRATYSLINGANLGKLYRYPPPVTSIHFRWTGSVSPDETSRMGWKRGQTYHDVQAPTLPKTVCDSCSQCEMLS
jgi:hypothetical protein